MPSQAREYVGLTPEEPAKRLKTRKAVISRIENHAENIGLPTLERIASVTGKALHVRIS